MTKIVTAFWVERLSFYSGKLVLYSKVVGAYILQVMSKLI